MVINTKEIVSATPPLRPSRSSRGLQIIRQLVGGESGGEET